MSNKMFWSFQELKLAAAVAVTGLTLLLPGTKAIALSPDLSNEQANSDRLLLAQVEGCPRATVVEEYQTDSYFAYICQTAGGEYFYRGVNKNDGSQVNVMGVLSTDSGTYYATNGDVTYWVDANQLQVTNGNGDVIFSEPVW